MIKTTWFQRSGQQLYLFDKTRILFSCTAWFSRLISLFKESSRIAVKYCWEHEIGAVIARSKRRCANAHAVSRTVWWHQCQSRPLGTRSIFRNALTSVVNKPTCLFACLVQRGQKVGLVRQVRGSNKSKFCLILFQSTDCLNDYFYFWIE